MAERQWNLGKQPPRPKEQAAAPPSAPAPTRPASHPEAPRRRTAPPPQTDSAPPKVPLGRPLPDDFQLPGERARPAGNPRNWKEFANHPVTLVSVSLAFCLFWIVYIIVKMQAPTPDVPTKSAEASGIAVAQENRLSFDSVPSVNAETPDGVRIASVIEHFAQPTKLNIGGQEFVLPETEPLRTRDGRILLSVAQMLAATASAIQTGKTDQIVFDTKVIYNAPMPEDETLRMLAQERADQAVYHLGLMAEEIAGKSLTPQSILSLAAILSAEGTVLISDTPATRAQMQSARASASNEQIEERIRSILPEPFARSLIAVRERSLHGT